MALMDQISSDLVTAMKAKDAVARDALRMLKSQLDNQEIKLGKKLNEQEELAVVLSAIKSRKDSIASYRDGGREDLAEKEEQEIAILSKYAPTQLSDDEAKQAVAAIAEELGLASKKDMGALMNAVMEKYRGQIDGKLASKIAASILS